MTELFSFVTLIIPKEELPPESKIISGTNTPRMGATALGSSQSILILEEGPLFLSVREVEYIQHMERKDNLNSTVDKMNV